MSEATHVYVGTTKCGCRVCVVVDSPDRARYTAKSISGYVRDGLTVTREEFDEYTARAVHHCTHDRKAGAP